MRCLPSPARGRSGNVAILIALLILPMIGVVGLAVDFGRLSWIKGKMDVAADSAALLTASAAANAWQANDQNAIAEGIAAGQKRFSAQSSDQPVTEAAANVGLTRNGGLFTSTVTYTAEVPMTFMRAFGFDTMPISSSSSASLSLNSLVDIQILMDVSGSMTIGATQADIDSLDQLAATFHPTGPVPSNFGQGAACAFACHWSSTNVDSYQYAHQHNVQLRVDVMRSAVGQVLATMLSLDTNNNYQVGLYTFTDSFSTVYPLSPAIAGASAVLSNVAPPASMAEGSQTDFTNAMNRMTSIDQALPWSGTQVPQRFLFLVTDGVYDAGSPRAISPFDPLSCNALKALGVTILVLYTPYTPIPDNSFYVANVEPIAPQISPDLQACASSPNYLYTASDAADIQAKLQTMLRQVVQTTSHLTQ